MADVDDTDFVKKVATMLGIQNDAVEELIGMLDADALTDLNDAVANNNKAHAEEIINSVDTDEDVNPLFRDGNDDEAKVRQKKRKHRRRVAHDYEYNHGDDVQVLITEPQKTTDGQSKLKTRWEDGTVYLPNGPDGTVGVKIQGKSKMVDRKKVRRLEENVLGLVGVPSLDRMQQLAGIQPAGVTSEVVTSEPEANQQIDPCTAAQQAMAALDVVESVLPNVRLADLKSIRQRIISLQTCMNESA